MNDEIFTVLVTQFDRVKQKYLNLHCKSIEDLSERAALYKQMQAIRSTAKFYLAEMAEAEKVRLRYLFQRN